MALHNVVLLRASPSDRDFSTESLIAGVISSRKRRELSATLKISTIKEEE